MTKIRPLPACHSTYSQRWASERKIKLPLKLAFFYVKLILAARPTSWEKREIYRMEGERERDGEREGEWERGRECKGD